VDPVADRYKIAVKTGVMGAAAAVLALRAAAGAAIGVFVAGA
jgi:hypothetical protein